MIENKFNCPPAIWKKFTEGQKSTYNDFRTLTIDDVVPANTSQIYPRDWEAISHNYSFFAAMERNSKKQDNDLWNYLRKKLKFVGDNNLTAREIFERITK